MLYLNRGWYAIGYFTAILGAFAGWLAVAPMTLISKPRYGELLFYLAVRIVAAAHGFLIARQRAYRTAIKWYAHWYSAIGLAFIFPVAVALTIRTWIYQPFDIPSGSMEPSLNVGDYFFASKFAYNNATPARGDLVVFYLPDRHSDFVKRIVGLPGDRIQMRQGHLFINGVMAPQRKIEDWMESCDAPSPCAVAQYEETLPGGAKIHVLDRVANGMLDHTQAWMVPVDSYFMLGDNRDNSDDSRVDMGFVPRSQIIGRVALRFMAGGKLVWQKMN